MKNILMITFVSILLGGPSLAMYKQITDALSSETEAEAKMDEYLASITEIDVACVTEAMSQLDSALSEWIDAKQLHTPDDALALLFTMHPFIFLTHFSTAFAAISSAKKIMYGFSDHPSVYGVGYADRNICRFAPQSGDRAIYQFLPECQASMERETLSIIVEMSGRPGFRARQKAWDILWTRIWCTVGVSLAKHYRITTNGDMARAKISHGLERQFYIGKYIAERRMKLESAVYKKLGPQFIGWIEEAYDAARLAIAESPAEYADFASTNPCQNFKKWLHLCKRISQLSPNSTLYTTPFLNNIEKIILKTPRLCYLGNLDEKSALNILPKEVIHLIVLFFMGIEI